ncbi:hypothetical protein N7505_001330 [Penicillium chrysogenum]|uniref:Uncharacterized protein n=1 Tax=Penicillium chrysogenum TaxID=5076 RepID=A0ABQ8WWC6_PENCH|nr:hypothetical protein N7505_001330 [Penicillium chrysogenum]
MLPEADIGFFLHSAFPSSEDFRCLAARKELLEGMLGADLVGFQVGEYSGHFLRTCARILSVEANDACIELEDRFHFNRAPWKALIVSCDKVDAVGGICQKLLSYQRFLNAYPEWANQVDLIQVVTTTTKQHKLEAGISDVAMRINSLYATLNHQPLVFLKQDLAFPQYLGLLTAADTLMITSLREGMNLTSDQFIHCQDGLYGDKRYVRERVICGIDTGLEGTKGDWEQLHQLVPDNSAINWVKFFKESMACIGDKNLPYRKMALPHLSVTRLK